MEENNPKDTKTEVGLIHRFVCPHCSENSEFSRVNFAYSKNEGKSFEVRQCNNIACKKFVVFVYKTEGRGTQVVMHELIFHYPNKS